MITINTILDMRPGAVPKIIHLSQYDSDFSLVFRLHASFGTLNIESGTTAEIRGTKKSGTGYSASATLNTTNNTVTVAGDAQMTAVAGQNIYEIVLTKNNKVLGSANFILLVERAALDADTITDASVLRELNAIVEGAETATQAAEDAEDAADRAEAAAESLEIDDTLTQAGQAADAKAVGSAISDLTAAIAAIGSGISDIAKAALLACFQHVAWTDEHGQNYYDALESALYADQYPKITATFNPGANIIYTDDALSTLKQYLTVKHYESASDSGTTVSANDYTLTGVLTEGTSTIIVAYDGLSTAITVEGVVDFYNTWSWSIGEGTLQKVVGTTDPNQSDTTMYPSRILTNITNSKRRTYPVLRGRAPYYENNKTGVATLYYPVPVPLNANHVKITMEPTGQYIYMNTVPYDSVNNKYLDTVTANRIPWTQLTNGYVDKDLTGYSGMQLFVVLNSKYDSAGQSYPVEPTNMTIEFSEV